MKKQSQSRLMYQSVLKTWNNVPFSPSLLNQMLRWFYSAIQGYREISGTPS